MNIFKRLTQRFVNHFGYEIRSIGSGSSRRTMAGVLANVARLGFIPNVVIDVGVAKGTPELYRVFPQSYFLLIEPLKEFEPRLKSILRQYSGIYVIAAAGPESKQVAFNVHSDHLDGSSLYKETMGAKSDGYEIKIPMMRIDDVLKEKNLSGPYLIKADVQGAELDVLDGCPDGLQEAEVVVLEVSMFQFMKGAPELYDVVFYMKERGFVAYDIILGWNRPLDNALGQIDIAFVKEDGQFRQDHSYSKGR